MTAKRGRRLAVIAIVAVLHAGVYGVFLETTRLSFIGAPSSSLRLTLLLLDKPETVPRGPPPPANPRLSGQHGAPPGRSNPPRLLGHQAAAPTSHEDNAIHPQIDWANEMSLAAGESASREPVPQPREFGAPHVAPAPPAQPHEFGWSRSRTHRIAIEPGSTVVHIGDHCVITFAPLPVPQCRLGKSQANGDLFKHMRDAPQLGDWKDAQ